MGLRTYSKTSPREAGVYAMRSVSYPETRTLVAVRHCACGRGMEAWIEGDQGEAWVPCSKVRYDTGERVEWMGPIPAQWAVPAQQGGSDA